MGRQNTNRGRCNLPCTDYPLTLSVAENKRTTGRSSGPLTPDQTNETLGQCAPRGPMNRDRSIAVVLALLLLASLACNWVLWRKSRVVGPAAIAKPEGRQSASARERGVKGAYELVANPEMKGRLGRVVIAYAE